MKCLYALTAALEYIEANLSEQFAPADVARAAFVSVTYAQRLFRFALHYSIMEYADKRRHSVACRELLQTDDSVCDIALRCGYNSHEVFCRSFMKLRGMTPSEFRASCRFADLHPKIFIDTEDSHDMKKVDITELYDELKRAAGTLVVCADICGLMPINENYSRHAGDIALAVAAERVAAAGDDGMFSFRIGRDEFVLVTGLSDRAAAERIVASIAAHNGECFDYEGVAIPLTLHLGLMTLPKGSLSYAEVVSDFKETIDRERAAER